MVRIGSEIDAALTLGTREAGFRGSSRGEDVRAAMAESAMHYQAWFNSLSKRAKNGSKIEKTVGTIFDVVSSAVTSIAGATPTYNRPAFAPVTGKAKTLEGDT